MAKSAPDYQFLAEALALNICPSVRPENPADISDAVIRRSLVWDATESEIASLRAILTERTWSALETSADARHRRDYPNDYVE